MLFRSRVKAREDGRLRTSRPGVKSGAQADATRADAQRAWQEIAAALAMSGDPADRNLAKSIAEFVKGLPSPPAAEQARPATEPAPQVNPGDLGPRR